MGCDFEIPWPDPEYLVGVYIVMTTTPLRPDLAHRAMLGRWLHVQAEAISRPWINSVLARRVYRPEQANSCLTEAGLRALYDSLATALERKRS